MLPLGQPRCRCVLIEKVSIEPSERSEDGRDLVDVLDRVMDKGIVLDPANRLSMMTTELINHESRLVIGSVETRLEQDEP